MHSILYFIVMRSLATMVPTSWMVLALLAARSCAANFVDGDFVPTARKSQFHGHRTQWHDVLGVHCPKFGIDRIVALPIPQPVGFAVADDYKIQLSLDGDRFVTPWLQLIGRTAPAAPYLRVHLVRSGDALAGMSAEVEEVPDSQSSAYQRVADDFSKAEQWPKHLIVHYSWRTRHEVDANRGLTVMFATGAAAMLLVVGSVVRTYQRQLRQFVEDVAGDGGGAGGGVSGAGFEKAD